jgi:hypothetical protein
MLVSGPTAVHRTDVEAPVSWPLTVTAAVPATS